MNFTQTSVYFILLLRSWLIQLLVSPPPRLVVVDLKCCSYWKFNNNILKLIQKCLDQLIITLSQIMNFLIVITLLYLISMSEEGLNVQEKTLLWSLHSIWQIPYCIHTILYTRYQCTKVMSSVSDDYNGTKRRLHHSIPPVNYSI